MEEGGKLFKYKLVLFVVFFYSKIHVAKLAVSCGKENSSQGENSFFSDSRLVDSV